MERDYFAEEIGNTTQDVPDLYSQEIEGKIPKSESFLQKALGSIKPQQVGYSMAGGPGAAIQDLSGFLASKATGTPQMFKSPMVQGEQVRKQAVEMIPEGMGRTVADIATDPQIVMGVGGLAKSAGKGLAGLAKGTVSGTKNVFKDIGRMSSSNKALKYSNRLEGIIERKGSQLSKKMGSAMDEMQAAKPESRISFLDDITGKANSPQTESLINKTLPSLEGKGNLERLTLKESQEVINAIKANLRQSLKTGETVKSSERGILDFINNLRKKQLEVFPEHAKNLQNYGEGIEAYGEVVGKTPALIEGTGNRITRAARMKSLEKVSPGAAKSLSGFQKTKKGVTVAKYAAGGGTAIGLGSQLFK